MIEVLFFARLREQLGCERTQVAATEGMTLAQLRQHLIDTHPQWRDALGDERLLAAVNHSLAKMHQPVASGDEVAFFPPVTGG